jgi:hypothetical protein
MPTQPAFIPAISRELEFIAQHIDDAEDIYNEEVKVELQLKELSNRIYDRAEDDALVLLGYLKASLLSGIHGLMRVDWTNARDSGFYVWGPIFAARGRKKRMGSVGLYIGTGKVGFRLIGWLFPRGGLDGRSELAHACQKKLPGMKIHLASEDSKRYPGWVGNNDCVVWLDIPLTRKISRDELQNDVSIKSKRFFKVAKLLL